jgi:hypothetical protein
MGKKIARTEKEMCVEKKLFFSHVFFSYEASVGDKTGTPIEGIPGTFGE